MPANSVVLREYQEHIPSGVWELIDEIPLAEAIALVQVTSLERVEFRMQQACEQMAELVAVMRKRELPY